MRPHSDKSATDSQPQSSSPKKVPPTVPEDQSNLTVSLSSHLATNSESTSDVRQAIQQYTEKMSQLPEIRKEKIESIQKAIESGTYAVSSESLANKLLKELQPHSSTSSS